MMRRKMGIAMLFAPLMMWAQANQTVQAVAFDQYFEDKTLRIDYTFSGDVTQQDIYVDKLNVIPRWYGKRHHLAEVPVEGNGQIRQA
jgi:hypothetical protein